jgi:hypothetical protein
MLLKKVNERALACIRNMQQILLQGHERWSWGRRDTGGVPSEAAAAETKTRPAAHPAAAREAERTLQTGKHGPQVGRLVDS